MTSKRRRTSATTTNKVAPTSTEQLPVVITEGDDFVAKERRNVKELTLFEVVLLPFLYLEAAVKYVFEYINSKYPLTR